LLLQRKIFKKENKTQTARLLGIEIFNLFVSYILVSCNFYYIMPTQSEQPITIVLVEDDTFLSKMYVEKLTREGGFVVKSVESGQKGLQIIQEEKPELVLLDIILPDINGVQVLKKMRQNPEMNKIPVLMLTNLNEKEYIEEATKHGAAGYLVKAHFTPNEVIEKIKETVRNAH
jgi:DNA-binding response OmpR family regulator